LLFDSGTPTPVNGDYYTIPVWWILDTFDNRNGEVVAPVGFDKGVTLSGISVFVSTPMTQFDGKVKIWKLDGKFTNLMPGTQVQKIGEALHSETFTATATQGLQQGGVRWVDISFKKPLKLEAGTYGISFGSDFEFNAGWVMGAPNGSGWFYFSCDEGKNFTYRAKEDGPKMNLGLKVKGDVTK